VHEHDVEAGGATEHLAAWLIHHLCEVCLLRALYLHTKPATNGATR